MSKPLISISNLSKKYGRLSAVKDLSFSVQPGEVFGFLGVNGAGKTTTLKMLAGILKPSSGEILMGGFDLAKFPTEAKSITGYIPDRPYLYPKLTAREFLSFVADLYLVPQKIAGDRISALLDEYKLNDWEHELIENFSHGMKQRLATCSALVHQPKILIVDEPMVGLDPHGAKLLKDRIRFYSAQGMSILLSTHSLDVAQELAHRLAIIHEGSLLAIGSLAEIQEQAGLNESHLEDVFLKLTDGITVYAQ